MTWSVTRRCFGIFDGVLRFDVRVAMSYELCYLLSSRSSLRLEAKRVDDKV